MSESQYQTGLIKRLRRMFPGIVILKNDSGYMQGVPDLSLFYGPYWAMLEVKESEHAPEQPNQGYYVDEFNMMSFASFIYPENEVDVLHGLQRSFSARRPARVS